MNVQALLHYSVYWVLSQYESITHKIKSLAGLHRMWGSPTALTSPCPLLPFLSKLHPHALGLFIILLIDLNKVFPACQPLCLLLPHHKALPSDLYLGETLCVSFQGPLSPPQRVFPASQPNAVNLPCPLPQANFCQITRLHLPLWI